MIAFPRRAAIFCLRTSIISARTSLISSLSFRGFRASRSSFKSGSSSFSGRSSAALAIAVSCAAAGGLLVSQAALSHGSQPFAVVASVPPNCQTFATSGVVPSGASHLTLSYSAGNSRLVFALFIDLFFSM